MMESLVEQPAIGSIALGERQSTQTLAAGISHS